MTFHKPYERLEDKKLLSIGLKNRIELFLTGFLHLCLVTANTYLIAKEIYWAIFLISFSTAFIWSYNVKKIAFGTFYDRIAYALGAAVGGIIGLHLVKLFI